MSARDKSFPFLVRPRRPPTIAFDAVCDLAYDLLLKGMMAHIEIHDLSQPFNVWMIRTKRIQVDRDFDAHDGGVFLSDDGRRLWLKSWGSYMGELVTLESGRRGPRWELLDQVVRAFVRYVYDPAAGLSLPMRR